MLTLDINQKITKKITMYLSIEQYHSRDNHKILKRINCKVLFIVFFKRIYPYIDNTV